MSSSNTFSDMKKRNGASLRAFSNIAHHWEMSADEQRQLLGIDSNDDLTRWRRKLEVGLPVDVPEGVAERIGCVLSIYASLVILLSHERSKLWVRAPNRAPIFDGKCAMDLMTTGSAKDLDNVARYLLAERES